MSWVNDQEMQKLLERVERDVEGWRPEVGEIISGIVLDIDFKQSEYGHGEYPIITLELEDGSMKAVHAFHTVAKNEIAKADPQIGDKLVVKYFGLVKNQKQDNEFHKYKAVTPRKQQPPTDWTPELEATERDINVQAHQAEDNIPF